MMIYDNVDDDDHKDDKKRRFIRWFNFCPVHGAITYSNDINGLQVTNSAQVSDIIHLDRSNVQGTSSIAFMTRYFLF